ncbi:phosphoglycerate mutase-like protein [Sanghuangporus baumii]|uniref:Phosphoglycerate mutase-like protein n=1 Tax=Sanghuangporus baumii TaxID=108892 RepID=A0A9Q5NEE2_SANBA|nr:phosphoglycerate mutase-like protein [Sanghuangporus baumii]
MVSELCSLNQPAAPSHSPSPFVRTIGVIILALYGDRTSYFQDPVTYKQGYTRLTPLGQAQEVQLGSYLRSEYLNPNSPNSIYGIAPDVVNDRQVLVRADNGGEGGAIVDSAVALLQGLFPPTPRSRVSLANGTTIIGPMNGYQYVPIESVEPVQSVELEGWSSCPNFERRVKRFYDSPDFKKKSADAAPFLNAIKPYLYGIPNTLENMVTDARATMALYRLHRKEWEKQFRAIYGITSSSKSLGKRKAPVKDEDDSHDQESSFTTVKKSKRKKQTTVIPGSGKQGISLGISTVVKRAGEKIKIGKLAPEAPKEGGGKTRWWATLDSVATCSPKF